MIKLLSKHDMDKAFENFAEAIATDYFIYNTDVVNRLTEDEQTDLYFAIVDYVENVWSNDLCYGEINSTLLDFDNGYLYQELIDKINGEEE